MTRLAHFPEIFCWIGPPDAGRFLGEVEHYCRADDGRARSKPVPAACIAHVKTPLTLAGRRTKDP